MSEVQKKWLAWAIVALAVVVAGWLGVTYPMPEPPVFESPVALGVTHFSGMEISGNETDELVVNQTGTGDIVEFRDNGTVVWRLADGGAVTQTGAQDLSGNLSSSTGAITFTDNVLIDGQANVTQLTVQAYTTPTTQLMVLENSGGTDKFTVDASGNTIITGTVNAQLGITVTENISVGTGLDVAGATNLLGAVTTGSTLGVGGAISLENSETISNGIDSLISLGGGLAFAWEEITPTPMDGGEHFTPTTTSLYVINSSGAVSMTLGACATNGQILFTFGDDANNVTINDTNVRTNDGSTQVMGQYDLITWMCIGTEWVEVSESNNS